MDIENEIPEYNEARLYILPNSLILCCSQFAIWKEAAVRGTMAAALFISKTCPVAFVAAFSILHLCETDI